jgi:hypothetical protein
MSSSELGVAVFEEACRLAAGPLEGIEEPAKALARMCEGDAAVLNEARKQASLQLSATNGPLFKQVASLLRRAFELGHWESGFEDTTSI